MFRQTCQSVPQFGVGVKRKVGVMNARDWPVLRVWAQQVDGTVSARLGTSLMTQLGARAPLAWSWRSEELAYLDVKEGTKPVYGLDVDSRCRFVINRVMVFRCRPVSRATSAIFSLRSHEAG